jgi:hypothetical protein
MKLHTILYDFADVIGKISDFEQFRLEPTDEGLNFNGSSKPASRKGKFVLIGRTLEKVEGIKENLRISNFGYIKKILHGPGFNRLTAVADISDIEKNTTHKTLKITNQDQECMNLSLYTDEFCGKLNGRIVLRSKINYEVSFRPAINNLEALNYWRKVSVEELSNDFKIKPAIENGNLFLRIGECESIEIRMKFANQVSGILLSKYYYDGDVFYRIVSLCDEVKDLIVSFSDQAVCRIRVLTSCAEYNFYLPALER